MRCPRCAGEKLFTNGNFGAYVCNTCYWRFIIFEPGEMIPRTMMKLLEKNQARKLLNEKE